MTEAKPPVKWNKVQEIIWDQGFQPTQILRSHRISIFLYCKVANYRINSDLNNFISLCISTSDNSCENALFKEEGVGG